MGDAAQVLWDTDATRPQVIRGILCWAIDSAELARLRSKGWSCACDADDWANLLQLCIKITRRRLMALAHPTFSRE